MERNRFVRIYSRHGEVICLCCDKFVSNQRGCPPNSRCACQISEYRESLGRHTLKEEYKNTFNNNECKVHATLEVCNMKQHGMCSSARSCRECTWTESNLKYLKSIS